MALRAILIGLGNRGKHWAKLLNNHPDVDVVSYCDTNAEVMAAAVAPYNVPADRCFTDWRAALNVEADFVCLVTPPMAHHEQAKVIFDRGFPLLAEKPLTLDFAESVDIVRWAAEANLPLTVGLNFRYLPVSKKIRAVVQSGERGKLSYGLFHYCRNRNGARPGLNRYPLTMEQPMLLEQSIHHFDLIRYCYDREILSVKADTFNTSNSMYAHDACVTALFRLEDDVHVTYSGTWVSGWNEPDFHWRTDFTEGVLMQEEVHSELYSAGTKDPARVAVDLPYMEPFIEDANCLLYDWVRALKGEAPYPCTGLDHLKTLGVTIACAESSQTGKAVDMAEFFGRYGVALK